MPQTLHDILAEFRTDALQDMFAESAAHLIFVTAFETRRAMQTFAVEIAWESGVWIAEDPDHMIHFKKAMTDSFDVLNPAFGICNVLPMVNATFPGVQ